MRVVGLTGGIGSGKSTVAELFHRLGVPLVDTDAIAHEICRNGKSGARAVAQLFGTDFLDANQDVDRAKLRERVWFDHNAKLALERALHPLIRAEAVEQLQALPQATPYAILIVPLLFETRAYEDVVWRTLVVDCAEDVQISRVKARSGLGDDMIRAIMAAQLPRMERVAQADDVIDNSNSADALHPVVEKLHEIYVQGPDFPKFSGNHL